MVSTMLLQGMGGGWDEEQHGRDVRLKRRERVPMLQQGLDSTHSANFGCIHDKLDAVINFILDHEKLEAILKISGMSP
jgi:hypothetical protein